MNIETVNAATRSGINERLKAARHPNQVNDMLAKARHFKYINPKTLRRAERIAAQRLAQLAEEASQKIATKGTK
jgi:septal ring factor EnvC (AmiA/AmiB activator)